MSKITCIRLLHESVKAENLLASISAIREGTSHCALFEVDTLAFNDVPNAPFAYWISHEARNSFKLLPPLENDNRTTRVGLQTGDNFRFVRCWWELAINLNDSSRRWYNYAKGGAYSPYYSDLYLVVNWYENGIEIKAYEGSVVRNEAYYLTAGLTWSEATTSEFGSRILPGGCLFDSVGPSIFSVSTSNLIGLCVLINSPQVRALMGLSLGLADAGRRHYTVGTVQRLPIANLNHELTMILNNIGHNAWRLQRGRDFSNEISHFFVSPLMGSKDFVSLDAAQRNLCSEQAIWLDEISKLEHRASELVGKVYGFTPMTANLVTSDNPADVDEGRTGQSVDRAIFSYLVGLAFGRWKIVHDPEAAKQAYGDDPFAPLPLFAAAFNAEHRAGEQAEFFEGDDLHRTIYRKLTEFFGVAMATSIESQICSMLSVDSIDEYLHRPAGFFADHLSLYSESRRQAPIYWPLSTKSGNFTIWVYYPKLDDQSLPKLIADVLSPKIRTLTQEIDNRRATPGGKIAELELLRQELEEMRTDFIDLINRGYRPNQNDGVLITACPLAKYFRHASFRKNLESCLKELSQGDYDWAHLAMSMWPNRVLEVCKKDRSIAIAHGKEELCSPEPAKAKRASKKPKSDE